MQGLCWHVRPEVMRSRVDGEAQGPKQSLDKEWVQAWHHF